jgi:phospholipid/cholesterol/gamma-HCH transport system ATP-binding protein
VSPTDERSTPGVSGQSSTNGEPLPENYFEFRDVCKAFDERPVLVDVSFIVKRAETCVIMGRSGVGKSVSLKHIMGFLRADSGQVIVDGEDVTRFS